MNAIDQYVAPAPPRTNPQPAQAPRGSDTSGGQTFGDVYNKAANTNQSDTDSAEAQNAAADTPGQAVDPTAAKAGETGAEAEKNSATLRSAATPIFALAADLKDKKIAKDAAQTEEAKAVDDPAAVVPKQDGKDKMADDLGKLIDKNKTADVQVQTAAPTPATEPDAATAALKLLGTETVAKGMDKKVQPDKTAEKDEPAKDKTADASADAAGSATDAANALTAASLLVHAAGGQARDQQEQGKPKSGDQPAKTVAALGPKGVGGAATEDTTTTSGAGDAVKPEAVTVTVLDARRFVGSGEVMSANTQAVMSGVTGDGDWAAAMKAASAAATATPEPRTATPVNTLKIQMTPESLGNVTATLRLHGDQLTVHLSVESGEAFRQMSQDKEGLIQSLKSQGYSVDQVSVQLTPAPTTDKAVAQTSSGQQTGGQMQDGSSAGQFAQQGREQDNNRRQQDNGFNTNWQGDDKSASADAVAPASDTSRSGQVYL